MKKRDKERTMVAIGGVLLLSAFIIAFIRDFFATPLYPLSPLIMAVIGTALLVFAFEEL